jgi:LEA14-like dessication related protein
MTRVAFALALALAVGCGHARSPQLRVIGMEQETRAREVVYVQVTNPASRPMRLTKLQYQFEASGGATVAEGELPLAREVGAGAAVVLEVPLDAAPDEAMTLRGKLIAEQDQIMKSFTVSAKIPSSK